MKPLLTILSWIYGAVIAIRHRLYNWGVFKSYKFDIPVVCVGNITVGGTGKTPMAEMLISELMSSYQIAMLSRGYGRKTKGYHEVQTSDSYLKVGDEPLQVKLKFPETVVVVSEDRVSAIQRIMKEHPEVNLIIMDDGFQHRRVVAKVNILILDATRPVEQDKLMPRGRLRDLKSRLSEGHFFIVSKCSEQMTKLEKRLWRNKLHTIEYQKVYFSHIVPGDIEPLFHFEEREHIDYGCQAILLAGVGNPRPFIREAQIRFNIVDKMIMPDHYVYTREDMKRLDQMLAQHPRAIVLMTEKDAVKLFRVKKLSERLRRAMYYQPIVTELMEGPDKDFIGHLIEEIEFKGVMGVRSKRKENNEIILEDEEI